MPVDRIDRTDAIRIHTNLARYRYAANRVIALLSAMMTYAEGLELRPPASNPCRRLERFARRSASGRSRVQSWRSCGYTSPSLGSAKAHLLWPHSASCF